MGTLKWRAFLESAVFVDSAVMTRVSEEEFRLQYRHFLQKLEGNLPKFVSKENTDIFAMFLDPNQKLYK